MCAVTDGIPVLITFLTKLLIFCVMSNHSLECTIVPRTVIFSIHEKAYVTLHVAWFVSAD